MSKLARKRHPPNARVDLGDPLPLHYKVQSESEELLKDAEDDEETAVDTKHYNHSIFLKKPTDNASLRPLNPKISSESSYQPRIDMKQDNSAEFRKRLIQLSKPGPLIRRDISSRSHTQGSMQDSEPDRRKLALIDEIERSLESLRDLIRQHQLSINDDLLNNSQLNLNDSSNDIKPEIDQSPRSITDESSSVELLQELERLQTLEKKITSSSYFNSIKNHATLFIFSLVIIFLITSFIVSGLNYDYCYYFC